MLHRKLRRDYVLQVADSRAPLILLLLSSLQALVVTFTLRYPDIAPLRKFAQDCVVATVTASSQHGSKD
jgi:hypothetical protein